MKWRPLTLMNEFLCIRKIRAHKLLMAVNRWMINMTTHTTDTARWAETYAYEHTDYGMTGTRKCPSTSVSSYYYQFICLLVSVFCYNLFSTPLQFNWNGLLKDVAAKCLLAYVFTWLEFTWLRRLTCVCVCMCVVSPLTHKILFDWIFMRPSRTILRKICVNILIRVVIHVICLSRNECITLNGEWIMRSNTDSIFYAYSVMCRIGIFIYSTFLSSFALCALQKIAINIWDAMPIIATNGGQYVNYPGVFKTSTGLPMCEVIWKH